MLILSKRSKSKAIHSLILTIWLLGKGNIVEIIKDQWLPGVPGKEGRQEWIDGAENLFIGCWHYSIQFCNSGDVTLWGRGERGSENSLSFLCDVLFSVNLKLLYKIKSMKTKKKKNWHEFRNRTSDRDFNCQPPSTFFISTFAFSVGRS